MRIVIPTVLRREYTVLVTVDYEPGYPPPPASSHDDPAFSDPGAGDEIEFVSIEGDCCELPDGMEPTEQELLDLRCEAHERYASREMQREDYCDRDRLEDY